MKSEIMKRAWILKRAGWAPTIGECMRAAWSEAKSGVMIDLTPDQPQPAPPAESETVEISARAWWLGWLATAG